MPEQVNESRPCQPGECDRHPDHPPCDRGWIGTDRICPCWAARRLNVVHHTGPAEPAAAMPMPASVRAALRTALADGRPRPRPAPPQQHGAVDRQAAAEPPPPDPRAAAILTDLGTEPNPASRVHHRLAAALTAALDAGWTAADLVEKLKNTADPDGRPAEPLWAWTLERLDAPTGAAA